MFIFSRFFVLIFAFLGLIALSACGDEEATNAESEEELNTAGSEDSDHDDEDHSDQVQGKEDEDHDGEDEDHSDHDHDDDKKSGLGTHEHGVAELSVAWNEGDMVIDFVSPTHNIFGFEKEAVSEEEKAIVEDRTKALSEPGLISINTDAGCELSKEVTTELEIEGSHAEITASWDYVCENPDKIKQLETADLFSEFPNLEDLDVQWVSTSGQSAAELSPSLTTLTFE